MNKQIGLSVLVVLMTISANALKTLLVREPGGRWSLPRGVPAYDEPLQDAAERIIRELVGKDARYLEQLYTFGHAIPRTKPREIDVAYYGLVPASLLEFGAHDPARINWFAVAQMPPMLADQKQVIRVAHSRLVGKLAYTAVGFELLDEIFTMAELQKLYEVILGKVIDKRNFRKKVLDLGILEPTGNKDAGHKRRGRPASRWRFRPEVFESIESKRDIFQF